MRKIFTPLLLTFLLGLPPAWMPGSAQGCTQPFLTPTILPAGNIPFMVVTGDFNGDTHQDLAVTNSANNNVSVLPGNGQGSFGAATTFPVGATPRGLTASDFNGDRSLDLAVANAQDWTVSVLTNNGSGSFNAAVNYTVGYGSGSITSGDFNGDGRPDLVATDPAYNKVALLLNDGNGSFNAAIYIVLTQSPGYLTKGDFNGDSHLDLVVAPVNTDNNLLVLPGNGQGGFGQATSYFIGTGSNYVVTGDFNGDSQLDLAAVNSGSTTVSVLLNNGSGGFATAVPFEAGITPSALAAADLNNDRHPDLVVGHYGLGVITVLLGDGNGSFTPAARYDTEYGPRSLATGDFNEDGKADLAVTNAESNTVSVLQGNGSGGLRATTYYGVGQNPSHLVNGDFNGDQKPDLALINRDETDGSKEYLSILLNNGNSGFGNPANIRVAFGITSLTKADFNGDYNLDLALVSSYSRSVLLGRGDGTFQASISFTVTGPAYFVTSGEFNGDNHPDLVVAIRNISAPGSVALLLGNGDGTFGTPSYTEVGIYPASIVTGDFNKDNNTDLAVANRNSNSVSVLPGKGDGTFGDATVIAVGTNPYSITAGDFTGDGYPDLAVANNGSNNVTILLNNGSGGFNDVLNIGAGIKPSTIVTGDFNRDGYPDLATATTNSDVFTLAVLPGNGTSFFGAPFFLEAGRHPYVLTTGDFNGDGRADLATTNNSTNGVSVLWNTCETFVPPGNILYVNKAATGANNGSSWSDAYTSFQDALALANAYPNVTQIWVAKGTYYPDEGAGQTGNSRTESFFLKNGLALYGGFAGKEAQLELRDPAKNATTLSGDIDGDNTPAGNSYHVVQASGVDNTAVLDGFIITGGNANGIENKQGGGMYNYQGSPTIAQCIFFENSAATFGGGIVNTSTADALSAPIITGCSFINNRASHGGGMDNYYSSPTVTNCTFRENTSTTGGGGIYNNYSSPTVSKCIFTGNTVNDYGGGIANANGSNAIITDCHFTGNNAMNNLGIGYGGGIENYKSSPTIKACSFEANAANMGGGVYNTGSSAPGLTDCSFTGNSAISGGGIYNNSSSPILTNCSFMKNTAFTNSGGGMYNSSSSPTLTGCSFLMNAAKYGGGLYNLSSSPSFTSCEFSYNSATSFAGGMYNHRSSPTLTACIFTKNTAPSAGAMDNFTSSSPTLTGCVFSENEATANGGALYNAGASAPTLTNCSFVQNSAQKYGGAVTNDASSPTLRNCLFWGNTAAYGAAVNNYNGSSSSLINCTMAGNTAASYGKAVYNTSSSPTLTNCILWGNTGGSGVEIYNSDGISAPVVSYSLVEGGYTGGTAILDKDPLFVNLANLDLRLEKCSPAVNSGLNGVNTSTTDQAGNPRVFEGTPDPDIIDMGAFELQAEGTGAVVVSTVVASKYMLAPPNHKMQDITLNYTVSGGCAPVTTVTVGSSEPPNGTGDGDTDPDWVVVDKTHVKLRAERAAQGPGRKYTITVTATDISGTSSQSVDVYVTHNITAPVSGTAFKLGSTVALAGEFWDKAGNRHTAKWLIDGTTSVKGTVTEPSGAKNGKVTGSYRFPAAGVYKLQMNVTDQNGVTTYANTAGDLDAIVVIYNPTGGYTYGGGYFNSPANALTSNPAATGKVSYGFAVNYFKGATLPKGETQFEFKVGELEFNALNFDYLAVSGARAQFRGTGKIIGGPSGINFILTAVDGALDGTGIDKVRIRIYNKNTGQVYYDNEPGLSEAANPTTKVGAGSTIVIQGTPLAKEGVITQAVNEPEATRLELTVQPNPTNSSFAVGVRTANPQERITLQVFDQWGRIVEERTVAGELTRIGAAYRPGTYYIRLVQGTEHREVKVIKLSQ